MLKTVALLTFITRAQVVLLRGRWWLIITKQTHSTAEKAPQTAAHIFSLRTCTLVVITAKGVFEIVTFDLDGDRYWIGKLRNILFTSPLFPTCSQLHFKMRKSLVCGVVAQRVCWSRLWINRLWGAESNIRCHGNDGWGGVCLYSASCVVRLLNAKYLAEC